MRRLTQEEVIESFREVHGNKYDYSEVVYQGTDETWRCANTARNTK